MADVARFARPRISRFVPPPPRRRMRLPLPALVIGFVILFISYGGQIFAPSPAPTSAPASVASVRVVDGDTLHVGDARIRLVGIDAPEKAQVCRDGQNQNWPCGTAATERLVALVAQGKVACTPQGRDRYGRTLAICSAGDVADIGGALVREGFAVSYMDRDSRYLAAENAARDEGRGLWRGAFERPADWRRRHRPAG